MSRILNALSDINLKAFSHKSRNRTVCVQFELETIFFVCFESNRSERVSERLTVCNSSFYRWSIKQEIAWILCNRHFHIKEKNGANARYFFSKNEDAFGTREDDSGQITAFDWSHFFLVTGVQWENRKEIWTCNSLQHISAATDQRRNYYMISTRFIADIAWSAGISSRTDFHDWQEFNTYSDRWMAIRKSMNQFSLRFGCHCLRQC